MHDMRWYLPPWQGGGGGGGGGGGCDAIDGGGGVLWQVPLPSGTIRYIEKCRECNIVNSI